MKVQFSRSNLIKIKLLLPFLFIRFFLHIYTFYQKKDTLPLIQDLNNELQQYGLPLFNSKHTFISNIFSLCWAFSSDPFFLTLFYSRVGSCKILKLLKEDNSSLYLYCDHIGKNITLHHPFSTIINCKSIGDNFIIKNNTTIGNIHDDNSLRPTLGDNVKIGANVTIFGDIHIGDNVTIGAGSVINKDIPDNCIAVGNPFRIIKNEDYPYCNL